MQDWPARIFAGQDTFLCHSVDTHIWRSQWASRESEARIMARIYLGNQEPSDRGALEALRRLPDEFHVFVEFTVNYGGKQRQADFLVIREEVRPCSLFLLEVKN